MLCIHDCNFVLCQVMMPCVCQGLLSFVVSKAEIMFYVKG